MLRWSQTCDPEGFHHRVTRAVYEENLAKKLNDPVFRADMTPLLRPGLRWNLDRAAYTVMGRLISLLPGEPWRTRSK